MLLGQISQPVINLVPHFVGGDGTNLCCRNLNSEIKFAPVADVDNHRIRTAITGEKVSNFFNWLLRGRKANAGKRGLALKGHSFSGAVERTPLPCHSEERMRRGICFLFFYECLQS